MKTIDLHIHTTASDGTFSPKELVDYAVQKHLSAIAITDHDTMRGIAEAINYIETNNLPLEIIPGIEISTSAPGHYMGLHILGYFIDQSAEKRAKTLKELEVDLNRSSKSPSDAIRIVAEHGGITSLAHPQEYYLSVKELDALLEQLSAVGLGGIEAFYTTHSKNDIGQYEKLANKHGMIVTGGSDFHGARKPGVDLGRGFGDLMVPYSIIDNLKQKTAA
jgi:predicted metal-dependent phosphoesterase TrpH